jgi:large conductance mechanosensitive channel
MLSGFKQFLTRGSVMDLAVGVIIGAAFGGVVTSLTKDVLTPVIGLIGGNPDFSNLAMGSIKVGNFVNAVVAFLMTAAALYFFIVLPYNKFMERNAARAAPPAPPEPSPSEKLLAEIRDLIRQQAR